MLCDRLATEGYTMREPRMIGCAESCTCPRGMGGKLNEGTPDEIATQTSVITRKGAERVIRFALELAHKRWSRCWPMGRFAPPI